MATSTLLAPLVLAFGAQAGDVSRDGRAIEPGEVGPAAAAAIARWRDWAVERGYRFELDATERVMLVVAAGKRSTKSQRKLVKAVLADVDELLPAPHAPVAEGASAEAATVLPDAEPDTWVLFELETTADQRALFDRFVQLEPWLEPWARGAAGAGGFTLEKPFAAGWVVNHGEGREEWNPDNELAHRLAHLALLDRYGQVPFWLQTGLCWQVEQEATGAIFSFPYRGGFVGSLEHGGWGPFLKQEYRREKRQPAQMDDLAAWQRGRFVEADAARAWGTARFLTRERPEAVAAVLADLSRARAEGAITRDGTYWKVDADHAVPVDEQEAIFAHHLGDGFLQDVADWFRKGAR